MRGTKRRRLAAKGWRVAGAKEFLGLTDDEISYLELRIASMEVTQIEIVDGASIGTDRGSSGGFWENLTVEQLAERHGSLPPRTLDDLVGDWPEGDSLDEFLRTVRRMRV